MPLHSSSPGYSRRMRRADALSSDGGCRLDAGSNPGLNVVPIRGSSLERH